MCFKKTWRRIFLPRRERLSRTENLSAPETSVVSPRKRVSALLRAEFGQNTTSLGERKKTPLVEGWAPSTVGRQKRALCEPPCREEENSFFLNRPKGRRTVVNTVLVHQNSAKGGGFSPPIDKECVRKVRTPRFVIVFAPPRVREEEFAGGNSPKKGVGLQTKTPLFDTRDIAFGKTPAL